MKIDLSKPELDLIDKALEAYIDAAHSEGATKGLITSMLTRQFDPNNLRGEMEKVKREIEEQSGQRRRQVTLLRAKIIQAEAIDSEHNVEQPASITPPPAHDS